MSDNESEKQVHIPKELGHLTAAIEAKPEALASTDKEIHEAALAAAKFIFDLTLKSESSARPHLTELLESMQRSQAPRTRAQARAAASKGHTQTPTVTNAISIPTPLASLLVEGMEDEQIWAQLELKAKNVCATLEGAFDAGENVDARGMRMLNDDEEEDEDEGDSSDEDSFDPEELEELKKQYMKELGISEEGIEMGSDDEESEEDEDEYGDEDEGDEEMSAEDEDSEEGVTELRDSEEDEDEMSEEAEEDVLLRRKKQSASQSKPRKGGHPELDDEFFKLDEFIAEIEQAESKSVSRGALSEDSDEEESEDEMIDLYTPLDDEDGLGKEARYEDFFDPPPKQPAKRKRPNFAPKAGSSKVKFSDEVKVKTIKVKGKGRSLASVDLWTGEDIGQNEDEDNDEIDDVFEEEDDEGDDFGSGDDEEEDIGEFGLEDEPEDDEGREAVRRLKDDLFADDEETAKSDLTTHEARMLALQEQIAQLESENVAEKDWVLKGEATSRSRPVNALLEEDLDFETVQKAVPVVTDEVVKDLEERIKARIIESRFDDVVRKRPVDNKPFLPSKMFELQDAKSKESLAQIYENEYIATQTGGTTDDRDGKLQKEHLEIERQWETICYKLDALSNAHFTPKQPKATISTISNVSAISMESALPTAKASSTILAPEEVFVPNPSDLRSNGELTPAEKRAQRAKDRKKKKKQRDMLDKSVDKFAKMKRAKGAKKQKEEALKSIVKSGKGVTVIGKNSQELKKGKKT